MGQTKSKEGKRRKPKGSQPTETSDPSDPNAPKVNEDGSRTDGDSNGSTTPVEGHDDDDSSSGEEELGDESIIFSKNKQIVTKDDFELLTVIGKGSFGKVLRDFISQFFCVSTHILLQPIIIPSTHITFRSLLSK